MTAQTDVNVLMLQRRDFDALLGPLQRLLDAQAATYQASPAKAGPATAVTKVDMHTSPLGILQHVPSEDKV